MQRSNRFFLVWLLAVTCLAWCLAGCDPGPHVFKGVKDSKPVSPQSKEVRK